MDKLNEIKSSNNKKIILESLELGKNTEKEVEVALEQFNQKRLCNMKKSWRYALELFWKMNKKIDYIYYFKEIRKKVGECHLKELNALNMLSALEAIVNNNLKKINNDDFNKLKLLFTHISMVHLIIIEYGIKEFERDFEISNNSFKEFYAGAFVEKYSTQKSFVKDFCFLCYINLNYYKDFQEGCKELYKGDDQNTAEKKAYDYVLSFNWENCTTAMIDIEQLKKFWAIFGEDARKKFYSYCIIYRLGRIIEGFDIDKFQKFYIAIEKDNFEKLNFEAIDLCLFAPTMKKYGIEGFKRILKILGENVLERSDINARHIFEEAVNRDFKELKELCEIYNRKNLLKKITTDNVYLILEKAMKESDEEFGKILELIKMNNIKKLDELTKDKNGCRITQAQKFLFFMRKEQKDPQKFNLMLYHIMLNLETTFTI